LVQRGEITVLDVATGSGDVLKSLARRAPGRVRGMGLDISHEAVEAARHGAPAGIEFRQADVMDPGVPLPRADVVMCSLFLHHLVTEQVPPLLARMAAAATQLVIVSDLERSALNWLMVGVAARLVTRSHVVHFDSLRSVEGAWTKSELYDLAQEAGLREVRVERRFPARLVLVAVPS
jgi:2-polyprenyl-3-methyl-5-hydroxy-6-metoxy-1,4-benzoquinol methylase